MLTETARSAKKVRVESATFDGKHLTCKCFSGQRHDLESGDVILFRSCPDAVCKITVMSLFEFAIDCKVPLLPIPPGDTADQVKIPQTFHHKRYSEAKCETLEFPERDDSKVRRFPLIHTAFQLADKFEPRPPGTSLTVPNSRKCSMARVVKSSVLHKRLLLMRMYAHVRLRVPAALGLCERRCRAGGHQGNFGEVHANSAVALRPHARGRPGETVSRSS